VGSLDTHKPVAEIKEGMSEFCQRESWEERVTERQREREAARISTCSKDLFGTRSRRPCSTHSYQRIW